MSTSLSERISRLHGMSDAEYEAHLAEQGAIVSTSYSARAGRKHLEEAASLTRWRRFMQWCKG